MVRRGAVLSAIRVLRSRIMWYNKNHFLIYFSILCDGLQIDFECKVLSGFECWVLLGSNVSEN